MKCIKKIQIEDVVYTANTDFRIAIECNRIAEDETIGDYERVLGIICTIFGGKALDNPSHYEKLLEWAQKWLSCGEKIETKSHEEPDMDYIKDEKYIKSSFKYDYGYNPYEEKELEWEDFYNDLVNLSNSEMGDCCILNRVRYWRNLDLNKIKDSKEREKARKTKEYYSLKKHKKHQRKEYTAEEIKNMEEFQRQMGF